MEEVKSKLNVAVTKLYFRTARAQLYKLITLGVLTFAGTTFREFRWFFSNSRKLVPAKIARVPDSRKFVLAKIHFFVYHKYCLWSLRKKPVHFVKIIPHPRK